MTGMRVANYSLGVNMKKFLVIPAIIGALGLMIAIERFAGKSETINEIQANDAVQTNNVEEEAKTAAAEIREPYLADQIEKVISKNKDKKAQARKGELHRVTEQLDKAVAADAAQYYENQ